MQGEQITPALVDGRFDRSFRGKSAGVLAFHLRRMPPEPTDSPGGLGDEVYSNILAYLLQANGIEAGDVALPADLDALADIDIPRLEGVEYDPDAPVVAAGESELLKSLTSVTDEMLRSPSPDDWLHTQASYNAQTYSPLEKINRENVEYLTLAWRAPLRPGNSMPMPLVHQGVMFLHTFPDTVLALDAANGQVLWRHQYKPSGTSSQKMGLALHGDKVLVPTSDIHVLALNAKTGEQIWDHEIVVPTPAMRASYNLRSAPLVVGDRVIQGVTASFVPKGGFLVGLDVDSGEEVWRFHTIARPGEPGGDSWNDVPMEKRSGGSVWHQGSYDPELDLIFFGIAPTYDTGPLLHPVDKEGVSSEALYTNSTIALRPDTGELVWHYQHMQNDQWDLDWVFERQIVDVEFKGATRRAVMNVGKVAILEAVEASTGRYMFSVDAGLQNIISSIDPESGRKTINMEKWPDPERPTDICPSAIGARSWPPTSYSPKTKLLYVPLTESCMRFSKEGFRLLTSGIGIGPATHPESADGMVGRVQAIDVENRKLAWLHEQVSAISTGLLATGGGLLFSGDTDPSIKAFNDTTGDLLWQFDLDDQPSSSLITYKVGETQYLAVVVGLGNFHIQGLQGGLLFGGPTPNQASKTPKGGAAIWVFAL